MTGIATFLTSKVTVTCFEVCGRCLGTTLSVVGRADGRLELLVAEGESVAGPILEIGNTNSRYRFPVGARRFVESWNVRGPAHHCAVGVGHIAGEIEKLGRLLGMEAVRVC